MRSSIVNSSQIKIIEYFIQKIFSEIVSISNGKVTVKISDLEKYPVEIIGEVFKEYIYFSFQDRL